MQKATAATDFLGQIGPAERQELLTLARHRSFRKSEFVFRAGDRGNGVHFLLSGRLKFFRLAPNGREVILWFCFPGEVFGMAEVRDAKGRRVNVQACEDSRVAVVPDAAFNEYLDDHPHISRLCRRVMGARMGILTNILVNLVADDAYTRIAKLILHLGVRYGVKQGEDIVLQIPLTHQEIANMVGTNRQTVTRIIGDLRQKGALRINNRRILIESEELLQEMICARARR